MKSNDVAGIGNFNTAEFWEYNTRTGRRLNLDPVVHPWESRYATFGSNPIAHSDVNGDDWYKDKDGNTVHSKSIHSQRDLNKKGIKGEYLGKTIKGHEPNGKGVFGDEDGVATFSLSTVSCKSGNNASVFGFGNSGDYNVVQAYRHNIADNLELRLRMDAIQHGMVGCLWAGMISPFYAVAAPWAYNNLILNGGTLVKINLASGTGDLAYQLYTKNLRDVNPVSSAANTFFGPFTAAFIGYTFNLSYNSITTPRGAVLSSPLSTEGVTNIAAGTLGNFVGGKVGDFLGVPRIRICNTSVPNLYGPTLNISANAGGNKLADEVTNLSNATDEKK